MLLLLKLDPCKASPPELKQQKRAIQQIRCPLMPGNWYPCELVECCLSEVCCMLRIDDDLKSGSYAKLWFAYPKHLFQCKKLPTISFRTHMLIPKCPCIPVPTWIRSNPPFSPKSQHPPVLPRTHQVCTLECEWKMAILTTWCNAHSLSSAVITPPSSSSEIDTSAAVLYQIMKSNAESLMECLCYVSRGAHSLTALLKWAGWIGLDWIIVCCCCFTVVGRVEKCSFFLRERNEECIVVERFYEVVFIPFVFLKQNIEMFQVLLFDNNFMKYILLNIQGEAIHYFSEKNIKG